MKLWIGYVLASFMAGLILWRVSDVKRRWALLGLCGVVLVGYYFLNQI